MNKLWVLRPIVILAGSDNPWEPWYDKAFGFVVSAETEKKARELAAAESGDEEYGEGFKKRSVNPWKSSSFSTCEVLEAEEEEVILRDFASA